MSYPDKDSLNELIHDVGELAERINRIDNLIMLIHDSKTKKHYTEEYRNIVDLYLVMCELLQQELERGIKYEKDNNLPITLGYHQILKEINETLPTLMEIYNDDF